MTQPASSHRIVRLAAFTVVGLARTYATGAPNDIGALWEAYVARIHEIPDAVPVACFGLCVPGSAAPGAAKPATFEYVACLEVPPEGGAAPRAPEGMVVRRVPAQTYAVFEFRGHVSGIAAFYDEIWTRLLPATGRRAACGPDFERYDDRFDGRAGTGLVEVFVPVE